MRTVTPILQSLIALCLIYFHFPCAMAVAQDLPQDRALQSMCRAGLTQSAIAFAEARRELSRGDTERYAIWTMRLMECQAQHALRRGVRDTQSWQDCENSYDAYMRSASPSAREPWIAWQRIRCNLLRCQATLARYWASPSEDSLREQALELVRTILNQVDELEEDIARRQPLAARQSVRGGTEAPVAQLSKLKVDAGLLRCEALLVRSRIYEPGSADRVAASTNVYTSAQEILASAGTEWASRDSLLVAQAIAALDLGRGGAAIEVLTNIAEEQAGTSVGSRAAVESIVYLLRDGKRTPAEYQLDFVDRNSPEYTLSTIRIALAEIQANSGLSESELEQRLTTLVGKSKEMGTRFGSYWQSRAEALLTGAGLTDVATQSNVGLDLMLVEVKQLLAAEDLEGAIDKLLTFSKNEASSQRMGNALLLARQAAELMSRDGRHAEAADLLERVSLAYALEPAASAAHAGAIRATAQALRADAGNQETADAYTRRLKQQLSGWPDAPESVEVQGWMRQWLALKQGDASVCAALREQLAAHVEVERLRTNAFVWLSHLLAIGDDNEQRQELKQLKNPSPELGAELAIVRQVGEVWLDWSDPTEDLKQLQRILDMGVDPAMRPLIVASQWLVHLRAADESWAVRAEQQASDSLPPVLADAMAPTIVEALDALPEGGNLKERQQRWIQWLGLDEKQARRLVSTRSLRRKATGLRLLNWQGDANAMKQLEALVAKYPRNGFLGLQLAQAKALAGERELEESTKLAARLVASSPPGSDLNLAARWRLLRNYIRSGQKAKAASAAKLLLAAQAMQQPWRDRFEQIAGP